MFQFTKMGMVLNKKLDLIFILKRSKIKFLVHIFIIGKNKKKFKEKQLFLSKLNFRQNLF